MKRLHVSVATQNIDASVAFYSTLFGTPPTVQKKDYAKWMLDDPRVNFVVDASIGEGQQDGVNHLGIQVEDDEDLKAVTSRLTAAEQPILEQKAATCCYARSDKTWSSDPQGVVWETFRTDGESAVYGDTTEGLDAFGTSFRSGT